MNHDSSGEALLRLREGGETALAEIFAHHRDRLRRIVRRRMDPQLTRRVDASDILQEGFVDAARQLDSYLREPSMPLFPWLRVVLTRQIIASYRRHFQVQKRDARREIGGIAQSERHSARSPEARDRIETPSQIVSQSEQRSHVRQTIQRLQPLDQEIIRLRHVEQLSNGETARRLGVSPSAASKRYMRAISRLRLLA